VKVEKNSLNNRFLPFSAIETEAILREPFSTNIKECVC